MTKLARIVYNSKGWQKPTGEAPKYEGPKTYAHLHGFGHEEWLFRSEWLIGNWRYSFVQGINRSHKPLTKIGQPFDLFLFTIEPDKKRRYVAHIRSAECLDESRARDAIHEFRRRG